jgi:hypothetical protein
MSAQQATDVCELVEPQLNAAAWGGDVNEAAIALRRTVPCLPTDVTLIPSHAGIRTQRLLVH